MICAAYEPTDRARALAAAVRAAIRALGWSDKEWGIRMRLTHAQQVARQLDAREPMNLFRLAELPDEFQREYDARKAAIRGAKVIEPQDLSLLRGYAALPRSERRRMARMLLPSTPERMRA